MNVLVAPLDWGLGHATRCIPVINELQKLGHSVCIAGSGPSLDLLRIEFPANRFFEIESYGISYGSRLPLIAHLISKARGVLSIIRKEHEQVVAIAKDQKIDFIISDNRYGCYHEEIPSAIITHQLSLQLPPILKQIANNQNRRLLGRFSACWVPDLPDHTLSGQLSVSDIPHKFIGPLSRMRPEKNSDRFEILALISGPEPHRATFDCLLTAQLESRPSYKIVRGLPSQEPTNGPIFNHLPARRLNDLINGADVVIARSGYSTIMDLAALSKKAIFVPTPGQTEQSYLARELQRKKIAPMITQKEFSLNAALERVRDYSGFTENYFKENLLEKTLREFLD
jgi:UDP:flavonoid glycosyltransferase YjiC (YdhE family)